MFQVNLRMMARPHRAVEAVKALRSIMIAARGERGYLASRIYQEVENPEALCLEEVVQRTCSEITHSVALFHTPADVNGDRS